MKKTLYQLRSGFDGTLCKTQSRIGMTADGRMVLTYQMLHISGCDWYDAPTQLEAVREIGALDSAEAVSALAYPDVEGGVFINPVPKLHKGTGKLLLTGNCGVYVKGVERPIASAPMHCLYAVYDDAMGRYGKVKQLLDRNGEPVLGVTAGCCDRLDAEDGTVYLPVYGGGRGVTVLKCRFDGADLVCESRSPLLNREDEPRGLCEPSLTRLGERYFLGLRADNQGYLSVADSPMGFCETKALTWDTGMTVPNFNTQIKWIRLGGRLYLVYTRRNGRNEHVTRCRAPLYMAELDTDRLCLLRDTEIALTPERGARCGNFGVCEISNDRALVVTTEWMQPVGCERFGSDNSIFVVELTV